MRKACSLGRQGGAVCRLASDRRSYLAYSIGIDFAQPLGDDIKEAAMNTRRGLEGMIRLGDGRALLCPSSSGVNVPLILRPLSTGSGEASGEFGIIRSNCRLSLTLSKEVL